MRYIIICWKLCNVINLQHQTFVLTALSLSLYVNVFYVMCAHVWTECYIILYSLENWGKSPALLGNIRWWFGEVSLTTLSVAVPWQINMCLFHKLGLLPSSTVRDDADEYFVNYATTVDPYPISKPRIYGNTIVLKEMYDFEMNKLCVGLIVHQTWSIE